MRTDGIVAYFVAFVVAVVIAIVITENRSSTTTPDGIEVEVTSGQVSFKNADGSRSETIAAGERIKGGTDGTFVKLSDATLNDVTGSLSMSEPETTPTPVPTVPLGVLNVRVVDALGDVIRNATLEINGTVYNATGGETSIEGLPSGSTALNAHANGYFSATQTVAVPHKDPVSIQLEYACEFRIFACDENHRPVKNAELNLWAGPQAQRPIPNTITVKTGISPGNQELSGTVEIGRSGLEFHVRRVFGVHAYNILQRQRLIGWNDFSSPLGGERLTAMQPDLLDYTVRGQMATPLRLWDSITMLSASTDGQYTIGMLDFNSETHFSRMEYFHQTAYSDSYELVASEVTDASGICVFTGLLPRVYFLQGKTLNLPNTPFFVLTPTDQVVKIPFRSENLSTVTVQARYENRVTTFPPMPKIEVKMTCRQPIRSFQDNALGKGIVSFEDVPWGEYELTVTPPADVQAIPASKSILVKVDKPNVSFDVYFKTTDGYRVSGRVENAVTHEPIPGYQVILEVEHTSQSERGKARRGRVGDLWLGFATTISGANGEFEFNSVIPGEYRISGPDTNQGDVRYLHPSRGLLPVDVRSGKNLDAIPRSEGRFWVVDADVENLIYPVLPIAETTLTGRVISTEGTPVPGMNITVKDIPETAISNTSVSDEHGRFSISFVLPDTKMAYETRLSAVLKGKPIKAFTLKRGEMLPIQYSSPDVARGISDPIRFFPGDHKNGIEILVTYQEQGCTIVGLLVTKNGNIPERVRTLDLSASQRQRDISELEKSYVQRYAQITEDGHFTINGLLPGKAKIDLTPYDPLYQMSKLTFPLMMTYCGVHLEVMIPSEQTVFDVGTIVLVESSYIHGRLMDENMQPIGIQTITVRPVNPKYGGTTVSHTNREGVFLITDVQEGVEYQLEYEGNTAIKLPNLTPPITNALLQVNRNTEQK